jgi:Type VIII secretion system (T8SS), CsgF protein
VLCSQAHADPLVQQFKDPTFSGNGWTTQALTIAQMEESAKAQVQAKNEAAVAAAQAAAANTPLAKFLSLFTSQVYSELATQLTNNLFSNCTSANGAAIPGCTVATSGTFNIDANTTVTWFKTPNDPKFGGQTTVTLTVTDKVDPTQNTTITVPIASFGF